MTLARYIAKNPPSAPLCELDARVVVVIPAHREVEHLGGVLSSLELERHPDCHCVVVVNGETDDDVATLSENAETFAIAQHFGGVTALDMFSGARAFAAGQGGVGAARRAGLDWALAATARPDVVLANLDADAPVDSGYLDTLKAFRGEAGLVGYEHDLPDGARGEAITAYETWMRYVAAGLRAAGSPYAYQNLGSIIVCTGAAYARAAGMPRRKGAEDFHFIQKLHKTSGPLARIDATVRPSARVSERVPFGTGPAVAAILRGEVDYTQLESPMAFTALGALFASARALERDDAPLATLPASLSEFLDELEVRRVLTRLRENHTGAAFERAFHEWFDALRTRQFLRRYDEVAGRVDAAAAVAEVCGISPSIGARDRLLGLRAADRSLTTGAGQGEHR